MASRENHIQQWKHNRTFLQTIAPHYHDWIVTVCFYTALHAVDTLLSHDQVSGVASHETRNRTLSKNNRYKQIYLYYHPLFEISRTVRYLEQFA